MHLKRGTIVEFVGAAHDAHRHFQERQVKDFFDKYGLQVGDKGKIWKGYRGSWISITWTLQNGTRQSVPMRSGNFKVVTAEAKTDSGSDSDSVPELESDEVTSETPVPLRPMKTEPASSVLFGFDEWGKAGELGMLKQKCENYESTLRNRCSQIKQLQRENAGLKKENDWRCNEMSLMEAHSVSEKSDSIKEDEDWNQWGEVVDDKLDKLWIRVNSLEETQQANEWVVANG